MPNRSVPARQRRRTVRPSDCHAGKRHVHLPRRSSNSLQAISANFVAGSHLALSILFCPMVTLPFPAIFQFRAPLSRHAMPFLVPTEQGWAIMLPGTKEADLGSLGFDTFCLRASSLLTACIILPRHLTMAAAVLFPYHLAGSL